MMDTTECTIYIVRHGETEWNVKGILQGQGDSPLTEKGIQQAKDLGKLLEHIHFDEVFSSDSLRAVRTAEFITLERKMAVKTTQLLRERKFGRYEGRTYDIYATELKTYLDEFKALPDDKKKSFQYPDIERDEQMIARFVTFLRETAVAYAGKTVLVVSHGAMIRSLLIHLGFGTYAQLPPGTVTNSAYIQLKTDGVEFTIVKTQGVTLLP